MMIKSVVAPLVLSFSLACPLAALGQVYPARPINMIVPLQAGSGVDTILRTVANKMAESLGQQIVVENLPGAAGVIGAERLTKAAPDGYTLGGLNDGLLTMLPNLQPKLPYDPLNSFDPVSLIAGITWVLVANPTVPVQSVRELVALAKAQPGKIDYSSGGNGSPQHVAMEAFKAATGVYMTHIPYRGATQSAMDVMSGQIPVTFSALSIVLSHIKAGKMRALGVGDPKRSPLLPDVPTIAEAGVPGFEFATWGSIVVPKGTPKPIIDRLNAEAVRAINHPEVRERLSNQGLVPIGSTPEALTAAIRSGLDKMSKVVKNAGMKLE